MTSHALLGKQLKRLGLDPNAPSITDQQWQSLRERIDRAYVTADQDRYLLERSLNLVSAEMRQLYQNLESAAEQRYQDLFESATDMIFVVDAQGRLTSLNHAMEEISGFVREDLLGRSWNALFDAAQIAPGLPDVRFEADLIARDGRRVPAEIRSRATQRSQGGPEFMCIARDVSEQQAHGAHLEYLAMHDSLTGLPNRAVLERELADVVARWSTDDVVVLGLLDLDQFKLINDTWGHAAGDRVLVTVANLLRACMSDATIVRISGDEFAFVLRAQSSRSALQIAEHVRDSIEHAEIRIGADRAFVSASIGLVAISAESHPGGLLAEADAAMYTAKDEGRNRIHWAGSENAISGRLAEVYRWATTLRQALEAGQVEVHYQTIVNLGGTEAGHYEALVRLRTADGQVVTAETFLPAAERFGLMPAVDRYVIDAVLDRLQESPEMRVFANLSALTLADPQMLEYVAQRLIAQPELGPRLGIEITETTALRDFALAREWIERLRGLGCEFALDDFGTGFNSLTYIGQLPVNQIKIDGSFVRDIASDPRQRAVVAAVKVLADGLGMKTVAECIETTAALDVVRALGVTYGQGYLLGRPQLAVDSKDTNAA